MTNLPSPTDLQRLARMFRDSLAALGVSAPERRLERWSILVHSSMSGEDRVYHGIEHVFDVADGAEPVQVLATLFHDTVYARAGIPLPACQAGLLADVVEQRPDGLALQPFDPADDPLRAMLERVFGLTPGIGLVPDEGLNELLSALLALRSLAGSLPTPTLLEIGASIEASIPFRCAKGPGESPPERLLLRLQRVNAEFALGLQPQELEAMVHRAVDLANRDVAGFAVSDTAQFLDSTWRLLPETNNALRGASTYTLEEYRQGLHAMTRFFEQLDPNSVFCRFRGQPEADTYRWLTAAAHDNIQLARKYLRAKLAASSLLSALARVTGGDATAALFMGDLPDPGRPRERLEDHLPEPGPPCTEADPEVFTLLHEGRRSASRFDIKNSPLTALIYGRMGEAGVGRLNQSGDRHMDNVYAARVLECMPKDLLQEIVLACARIATTRTERLLRLIQE